MLVEGLIPLLKDGILKRRTYEDISIQRLLNQKKITELVSPKTIIALQSVGAISNPLTLVDIAYLKRFGILQKDAPDEIGLDWANWLGTRLTGGVVIQGAFYLGSPSFYSLLRKMDEETKKLINMTSVLRINQLYGHEALDRLHRKEARFINSCLMVTLSGAAVSDGVHGNRVLSGVGGQYNFVSMAQALPDGYSCLCLRSTRVLNGRLVSNIVWEYPHVTIPRHLRDIVITEYGIADVRGKTDEEIIMEILKITDSRFQADLLLKAKKAGKISVSYEIPHEFQNNFPEKIQYDWNEFRKNFPDLFPAFPFGSDLTEDEVHIARALKGLKAKTANRLSMIFTIAKAFMPLEPSSTASIEKHMAMMKLDRPITLKERLFARLLRWALATLVKTRI